MLSEIRERFALAIVARVPIDRIVEIHFFHPIRQGGAESGVAVLAAVREEGAAPVADDVPVDTTSVDTTPVDGTPVDGTPVDATPVDAVPAPETQPRYTIYSARYRLTLKGPERGRWETSIVAEADAPLPTVDAVVRGVLRRAGDEEDVERMSGDELRAQLHAASRT